MRHIPLNFNNYIDICNEKSKNGVGENGSEIFGEERMGLHDLFYTDDLVLCSEPEENLRVTMGRFVEAQFAQKASLGGCQHEEGDGVGKGRRISV